jgi:hypothetical protein
MFRKVMLQGTGWVVDRCKKLLLTCQHVVGHREQGVVIFPKAWRQNLANAS